MTDYTCTGQIPLRVWTISDGVAGRPAIVPVPPDDEEGIAL